MPSDAGRSEDAGSEDAGRPGDAAFWSPVDGAEWYAAREAAAALRDVLISADLHRDFPFLRADVNAFGLGFIELGRISPRTAQRIAELLRLGLAAVRTRKEHEKGEPT